MSVPIPSPGRFERVLYRGRELPEPSAPSTTFTPCRDGVLRHDGGRTSLLTPAQVSELLALYERQRKAAEAEAERCDALFHALWTVRCDALDRCCGEAA